MKFTDVFNVTLNRKVEWFDPFLNLDTKLFIDPFLIYKDDKGFFKGSHAEVIEFFNTIFKIIAKSGGDRTSSFWKRAESILVFPEAEELCLGYSVSNTKGAGSGKGFAKLIAEALWEAIEAGVDEVSHFEEIGILREGIGADRISDITATLLKHRLVAYTESICKKYNIETKPVNYGKGYFDYKYNRWMPLSANIPINPFNKKPVLLLPRRYLRNLPTINSDDFWDYCCSCENETIRLEFGQDILDKIDKQAIIRFARKHPELRNKYLMNIENEEPAPYDFEKDKKGYFMWYPYSAACCKNNPLQLDIASESDLLTAVYSMIEQYINYIENNNGWKLLWNDNGKPKNEEASQLLLMGIIQNYCKANNIDISREVNIGRGPVDFKISKGYDLRILLELKLAKNSKFWNGVTKQLPKYLEAESVNNGIFMAIALTDNDLKRIKDIESIVLQVKSLTGKNISYKIVDSRRNPLSASKL